MPPVRVYMALMLMFVGAMLVGSIIFYLGMNGASYLVSDGVSYGTQYLNKPRYDSNLTGFVFSVCFLVAGIFLLALIAMPDDQATGRAAVQPPQPRRRQPQTPAQPQPQATPRTAEPAPEAPARPSPAEAAGVTAPVSPETPSPRTAGEEEPHSVDEEVLQASEVVAEDLPPTDMPDRYEDTGEDDVIYGSGRVTDDTIWEFIQTYPDSAVKFLYRKTLENKALSPTDEDIYRRWELRGMTRAKVREFVLAIMGWKTLRDDFPHNIWRELRDQIFEMQQK